ncbi:MAG TPA: septation protein SpoVG family protein [Candidatus Dojkabacteria bacterium]|nr:septation protein SpoVG family protein [Candidatus Dojkabacteria bacterium]
MKVISEIHIVPVKPQDGLVAFCTFVLYESVYCSSIAIMTRLDGSYRLLYPSKRVSGKQMNIFYPINKETGVLIEEEVINKFKEVMNNDRYNSDKHISA